MAKYRVVGSQEVLGHAPGSAFELELTQEQEAFYVDAGHLAKAPANTKPSEADPVVTPAAEAAAAAEGETQTPGEAA